MRRQERPPRLNQPEAREPTVAEKHIRFAERVNGYSEKAQEVVTSFSSMFLEPDIAARVRSNPTEVKSFIGQLTRHGLPVEEVEHVLGYFDLPNPIEKNKE